MAWQPDTESLMAQAQAAVQAQLAAMVAQTRRASRRETRSGRRFIRGLTRSFMDELDAIGTGVGDVYDSAKAEQAAINSSLGSYLSGGGARQAAGLGRELQQIDPQTAAFHQARAEGRGQNLGRQGVALGTQALQGLVGEGAGEESFARALPGIGALSGIQSARGFQRAQGRELHDSLDAINAQAPGLTQQLFGQLVDQAMQQRSLALQERQMAQERELALLGLRRDVAGQRGEGRARVDETLSGAQGVAAQYLIDPLTGQPKADKPPAHEVYGPVSAYIRSRHPGKSDAWVRQQAQQTLAVFGITISPESSQAASDFISGLFGGGGPGGGSVRAPGAQEAAGRPAGGRPFFSPPSRQDLKGPGFDLWKALIPGI